MPKRTFKGSPIDATMQYVSEASDSGSVEVPSDGDEGKENTDAIPSFVDRDEYTDTELNRIRFAILNPNSTLKDLCEKYEFNYQDTSTFLARFRREHETELKEADLWGALTFGPPQKKEATHSEREEKSRVKGYFKRNPKASIDEAVEALDIDALTPTQIAGLKGTVTKQISAEETEQAGEKTDTLRQDVDELQKQVAKLADAIDTIASDVEAQQEQPTADSLQAEISDDTLFAIVSGNQLTDKQRREVFEVLV